MREMLGEELRLLYVAMTRARDLLILSGAVPQKKLDGFEAAGEDVRLEDLLSARCYADWVGAWFSQQGGASGGSGVRWVVHDTAKLLETPGTQDPAGERGPLDPANAPLDPAAWQALQNRLAWQYPHPAATYEPAKTSVSILRRRAEADEIETAANLFPPAHPGPARDSRLRPPSRFPRAEDTTALDIGMAHHEFLQLVSLDRLGSAEELRAEALRLRSEGAMDENAVVGLDFKALTAFWSSEVGRKIRAQSRYIHRELEFTARFSPPELAAIIGRKPEPGMDDELVVVQGVADLVVLLPKEIWLLDYKTEAVSRDSLDQRVKGHTPQIKLYAQALSRIYSRPVSNAWLYFLAPQTAVRIELD
jgi:ATP-dependent helicase/nuclease subunit A